MFNIFILGPSQSGKTSIARKVSKALVMPIISASDWVRKTFDYQSEVSSVEGKDKFIAAITGYSLSQLQQDPEVCLKYIKTNYPDVESSKGYILEGFRSPKDFLTLFNPRTDLVFLLKYEDNPVHGLSFEQDGLYAIEYCLEWMVKSELCLVRQCSVIDIHEVTDESVANVGAYITNSTGIWIQECP